MTSQISTTNSARYLALTTLDKVFTSNAYSNLQLNQTLDHAQNLSTVDRNLLTNLVYGVIQHKLTLEHWLAPFIKGKKLESWVNTLLLLSLYQYRYLDRVPKWAITDEAIKIAKIKGHVGIRKLVTAILHSVLRQGEPNFTTIEDPVTRLSIIYSVPEWLIAELQTQYGVETTTAMLATINHAPHQAIRVNTQMMSSSEVTDQLVQLGFEVQPSPVIPDSLIVTGAENIASTTLFSQGAITIQDESAGLAVDSMRLSPADQVLDACAAPGGKTVQIAQSLDAVAGGRVTALDIHTHKIKLISTIANRMHVSDVVHAVQLDARQVDDRFPDQSLDHILVDAPCSGFGLIRRKPEIRYEKQLSDSLNLQKIQLSILEAVAPKIKKGGIITYSTCTILQQENTQVVDAFLRHHPDFSLLPTTTSYHLASHSSRGTLTILPHDFDSDGFFVATIKRNE